jgi:hypothetical protein
LVVATADAVAWLLMTYGLRLDFSFLTACAEITDRTINTPTI